MQGCGRTSGNMLNPGTGSIDHRRQSDIHAISVRKGSNKIKVVKTPGSVENVIRQRLLSEQRHRQREEAKVKSNSEHVYANSNNFIISVDS